MTDKLCTKYKKLVKRKFNGFELWKECLADNIEAWKDMETYNKYDVLSDHTESSSIAPPGGRTDNRESQVSVFTANSPHKC